ncbi:MAG TPA: MAPEG family protein [Rhizomicrobium sp.]|nr:MAPEG family protein [Rhizomicrobium sp.]
MDAAAFGSVEMKMLWLSIVLGLFQLLFATLFSVSHRGLPWGVSARDEPAAPMGTLGGRIERAYRNFLETFVFFLAAVLMVQVLNRHSASSVLGAQLFFWARLAYLPAYALGIPWIRTLIWAVSLVGIAMVLRAVWPGM